MRRLSFEKVKMCAIVSLIFVLALLHLEGIDCAVTLNKCPTSSIVLSELTLPPSIMTDRKETSFRLQSGAWKCSNGDLQKMLQAEPISGTDRNGTITEIFVFSDLEQISPAGLLEIEVSGHSEYFNPDEYCIDSFNESELKLRFCNIPCGGNVTCIPKCCIWGKALPMDLECLSIGQQNWSPSMHQNECSTNSGSTCLDRNIKNQHLHYTLDSLPCEDPHRHPSTDIPFQVLMNGSILFSNSIVISSGFCLDGLLNDDGNLIGHMLLICIPEETEIQKNDRMLNENVSLTLTIIMFISSFFLFLTVLVYILIWDKHNLHGYTVFSHSVSMFFMLMFLATAHTMSRLLTRDAGKTFACVGVAVLSHYFFLSTFCWLTMLNFDLFWTFRTLSPTITKSKGLQRFFMYSAFAWGLPICFVSTALILDQTQSEASWLPHIEYGNSTCYIKAQGYYLYLPIGILLVINLLFFGTTVYIMYKYQQSTKSARAGKSNGQTQSFRLFAKLFLVMGVTWIFEVISWAASPPDRFSFGWVIFDCINLFQGIGIFIIFVCKRQVLSHLWNKYPCLRCCLTPLTRLNCCKLTGMDVEGREISGGRTTQSNISMKNYSRANSLSDT